MNDDVLRDQVIGLLPTGRENAIPAKHLAAELGVSPRLVGQLVEQAIVLDGYCVGSLCGDRHGYYLIRPDDLEDLEQGVGHSVKRAAATFARVRALRRNYEAMPGALQTNIFDLARTEGATG